MLKSLSRNDRTQQIRPVTAHDLDETDFPVRFCECPDCKALERSKAVPDWVRPEPEKRKKPHLRLILSHGLDTRWPPAWRTIANITSRGPIIYYEVIDWAMTQDWPYVTPDRR